jgi:predicted DNA-binding transcriptional regulator AlpA
MTAPRRLLVADEVSALTTLAPSTLYDWASKGTGPKSFKFGRRRVWVETDVLAWIAEQEAKAS